MAQQIVIDRNGQWFLNTGAYVIVDTETGNRFESGKLTKVKSNEWVKSQPTLVECNEDGEALHGESTEVLEPAGVTVPAVPTPEPKAPVTPAENLADKVPAEKIDSKTAKK